MVSVHRFISMFREKDELLEREIEFLIHPALTQLQEIFGMDEDNPMYDEFEIDPRIAKDLAQFTGHRFDFNKYSYFLSCTSS